MGKAFPKNPKKSQKSQNVADTRPLGLSHPVEGQGETVISWVRRDFCLAHEECLLMDLNFSGRLNFWSRLQERIQFCLFVCP